QVHRLQGLRQRQPRLPQQPLDPPPAPCLAFALGQLQQVPLIAVRLLLRAVGQLLEAAAHRRQMQLLEVVVQLLFHVLLSRNPRPPFPSRGGRTRRGPRRRPSRRSPAASGGPPARTARPPPSRA